MKRFLLLASVFLGLATLGSASVTYGQDTGSASYQIVQSEKLHVVATEKCKASWLVGVYVRPNAMSRNLIEQISTQILQKHPEDERVTIIFSFSEEVAREFPRGIEDEEADLRSIRAITMFDPNKGTKKISIFPKGLSVTDPFLKEAGAGQ